MFTQTNRFLKIFTSLVVEIIPTGRVLKIFDARRGTRPLIWENTMAYRNNRNIVGTDDRGADSRNITLRDRENRRNQNGRGQIHNCETADKNRATEIKVKPFERAKMYELAVPIRWLSKNGKTEYAVTHLGGEDLNYAIRTVYAEAGGFSEGTQEERKAMADMLTNRIGASGMGKAVPKTYAEVVEYPKQFESYLKKTPKFLKGGSPKALRGDSIKEWNLAYDAVATEIKGGPGPAYPFTSNRSAKTGSATGWTIIGVSRFKADDCGWKWVELENGSMGWDWVGLGRKLPNRQASQRNEEHEKQMYRTWSGCHCFSLCLGNTCPGEGETENLLFSSRAGYYHGKIT